MNKRGQAILYYMFMQADSEITEHEKKIYNTICAELELDEGDIAKVVEKLQDCKEEQMDCLGYVKRQCEFSELGLQEILLRSNKFDLEELEYTIKRDEKKEIKAAVMWNLINLGYADKSYSCEEKEVVKFLKDYWKIPEAVYQEMIDVSETCLALSEYEKWAETLENSAHKVEKLNQIRRDLKKIEESIKITIEEYAL